MPVVNEGAEEAHLPTPLFSLSQVALLAPQSNAEGGKKGQKKRTRADGAPPGVTEQCPVPIKTTLIIMPATLISQVGKGLVRQWSRRPFAKAPGPGASLTVTLSRGQGAAASLTCFMPLQWMDEVVKHVHDGHLRVGEYDALSAKTSWQDLEEEEEGFQRPDVSASDEGGGRVRRNPSAGEEVEDAGMHDWEASDEGGGRVRGNPSAGEQDGRSCGV